MPAVTVIVIPEPGSDGSVSLNSVRAQTFDDWEAIVLHHSNTAPAFSASRVSARSYLGAVQPAINAALRQSSAEYVLILSAGAALRADALQRMVACARAENADAVIAESRFIAPLGEIPALQPPIHDAGPAEWDHGRVAPLAAQLFRRQAVREHPLDASHEDAADWEWCRRLAGAGVHWSRYPGVVVDIPLRPLPAPAAVLSSARRHAALAVVPVGAGALEADTASPFEDAVSALELLAAHPRTPGARMKAGMPTPWLLAQWW
jgi:hypothetical protein